MGTGELAGLQGACIEAAAAGLHVQRTRIATPRAAAPATATAWRLPSAATHAPPLLACRSGSVYLHKDRDGPLAAGPAW